MDHKKVFAKLMVASCTCQTKTPDASFHRADCNYALLCKLQEEFEQLLDDRDWRNALEMGGVGNWAWYEESLENAGYYATGVDLYDRFAHDGEPSTVSMTPEKEENYVSPELRNILDGTDT